jgi:Reverse transcriptase (RNA-dependent DNA polymerase)/RNase H-like domain found in reverse transcriptase/Integrase zinc binding domain/Retroviral aspartyl protease
MCPGTGYSSAPAVKGEEVKVKKEVNLIEIIESDESCSFPVITVNAKLEDNTLLPSTLADCGASINLLDTTLVEKHKIKTRPIKPFRLHQAITPNNVIVNKEVVSHVSIPSKSWTSIKPAIFAVAPLPLYDALLGMPFLSQEKVLINAANRQLVLPPLPSNPPSPSISPASSIPLTQSISPAPAPTSSISLTPSISRSPAPAPSISPSISIPNHFDNEPTVPVQVGARLWVPTISPEEGSQLHNEFVNKYSDVFTSSKLPNKPPSPGAPRHRIILKDKDKSINGRMYRVPTRYWDKMIEFIEEHLQAGRIRLSSSHIASGTWMIPKHDLFAFPWVVHDYRQLNENTVKDHTPLPRQDEIIQRLTNAQIRGKIDLTNAYYQIPMEEGDIHKTAFKTPFGMYEWTVMPQGLCNAPATFQRYMNGVLRKYVGKFCSVYVDDIAIWSNWIEEHKTHVQLILDALRRAGILASKGKSILFTDELEFLGHIISSRGIQVSPEKVAKILASRTPRSPQDILEFNGLVNYIALFIPGLSKWSTVLSNLTKKNVVFKWEQKHQDAFENIKRLASATPICKPIAHSNPDPVFLVADASNNGLGGYYGQGTDFKTMRPAGFHSRAFNSAEKNYPTHDKEMLAIIDCMKKWDAELSGIRFDTLSDHAPLTRFKTQKDLSPRQIRWNETFSRYDTDIHHTPGITNSAADALSRYPFVQGKPPEAPFDQIYAVSTVEFNTSILESVKAAYKDDSRFSPAIEDPTQYSMFQVVDGLIFFEERLCIPKNDRKSREALLSLHHDSQNHFGIPKTRQSITMDYCWPGLTDDIEAYIKSCPSCARNKSSTQAPAGLLHSMPIPHDRFSEIAIDFVSPLPKSKGFDMLAVITDRLTNYVRIEPTH